MICNDIVKFRIFTIISAHAIMVLTNSKGGEITNQQKPLGGMLIETILTKQKQVIDFVSLQQSRGPLTLKRR
ncbi:hypothetical protein CYL18_18195 [Pradoshia eiseniae]|uniref:Uncharacterized protein n=1 Tax=Pradoshia eiseniae TaxID=2064768 RepID=A0A2S7MVF4_9BACI|nr:hypothetical protein CYL18_18195 [Pradoshia eiseniae]